MTLAVIMGIMPNCSFEMNEPTRILGLYFSPAGSTQKIVRQICESLSLRLNIPYVMQSYTTPLQRQEFAPIQTGDFVVWGTPVYAGRVPNKTLSFVNSALQGEDNPLLAVAVYGGRHYDDCLAEMAQIATKGNFRVVGAAAMVSRHVFSKTLGAGRPNDADFRALEDFCNHIDITQTVKVPGMEKELVYYTPLKEDKKPARFLKATPRLVESRCVVCRKCVRYCSMGSIQMGEIFPQIVGTCIKCMACVTYCPEKAWLFDDEDFLSHIRMIEQNCAGKDPGNVFVG